MNCKWTYFPRTELICFLEGIIYNIGVTEKRAYYIERVKNEIGFSYEDLISEYYNNISKLTIEDRFLYIAEFKGQNKEKATQYLLGLLSCDPESPITKIGLKTIINLTKSL